jgi:hypothetical protein
LNSSKRSFQRGVAKTTLGGRGAPASFFVYFRASKRPCKVLLRILIYITNYQTGRSRLRPADGSARGREKAIAALNLASAAERALSGGHTGLGARPGDSGARFLSPNMRTAADSRWSGSCRRTNHCIRQHKGVPRAHRTAEMPMRPRSRCYSMPLKVSDFSAVWRRGWDSNP